MAINFAKGLVQKKVVDLKLLQLLQPTAVTHPEMFLRFEDYYNALLKGYEGPKHTVPFSYCLLLSNAQETVWEGQKFRGLINLNNVGDVAAFDITVQVSLTSCNGEANLFDNLYSPSSKLEPGNDYSALIEYEFTDLGDYRLKCRLEYQCGPTSEKKVFERAFLLRVKCPFHVSQRTCTTLDDYHFTEISLRNNTELTIQIPSTTLKFFDDIVTKQLNAKHPDEVNRYPENASENLKNILEPGMEIRFIYSIRHELLPKHLKSSVAELKIHWTSTLGSFKARPILELDIDTTRDMKLPVFWKIMQFERLVKKNESFEVIAKITNTTDATINGLSIFFDDANMYPLIKKGSTINDIGSVKANSSIVTKFSLNCTVPGTHGLRGIFLRNGTNEEAQYIPPNPTRVFVV